MSFDGTSFAASEKVVLGEAEKPFDNRRPIGVAFLVRDKFYIASIEPPGIGRMMRSRRSDFGDAFSTHREQVVAIALFPVLSGGSHFARTRARIGKDRPSLFEHGDILVELE